MGDPPIGRRVGPYEIVSLLGTGGMGAVYRAHDTRLNRDVAVKVLLPSVVDDPDRGARLVKEARVLAGLNHPNIAQVFGLEEADGGHALVLELVDGPTLADRVASGPLPLTEALVVARQIAEALAAAHRYGVIHRDLKPANVKMRSDGTVKVLDFGLAKVIERYRGSDEADLAATQAGETRDGMIVGTPAYMAPEQVRGQSLDARADLWAFGCVLFEMLTGGRAFGGRTLPEALLSVLEREPDWAAVPASTPMPILTVLRRCLEKDPVRRLDSASAARLEIEDVLASVRPTVPGVAARRSAVPRRSKAAALALLVGAVALWAVWYGGGSWNPGISSTVPIKSLAVLPLSNLSGDDAQDYFSDGMTDALITALARISSLRVTSRTSSMQYKGAKQPLPEIAKQLGVEGIVEGSVVREGNRVRITAQLIHAGSDRHVWGQSYEQDLVDVLSLQQQVARAIAEQVRATLTPAEVRMLETNRAVVPEAQEAYLRGLHLFNTGLMTAVDTARGELLARGVAAFEQASRVDPQWAEAWAALARARHWVASYGEPALYPAAKAAALKAIELDETNATAHAALAFILQRHEWKWAEAEREFKRAIELNPSLGNSGHHGYALLLSLLGRHDEALAMFAVAEELDPLVHALKQNAAYAAVAARRYDEALDRADRAREAYGDAGWIHEIIGRVRAGQGRAPEALAAFERFQELAPGPASTSHMVCGLTLNGRRQEAERLTASLARQLAVEDLPSSNLWELAVAHTCLGNHSPALDALERMFADRVEFLPRINRDRWLDPLRSEPRFQALLTKMNLPATAP
jgi:serine/threonine protein kinase/tetratricopeptide (TPR) repeat protein